MSTKRDRFESLLGLALHRAVFHDGCYLQDDVQALEAALKGRQPPIDVGTWEEFREVAPRGFDAIERTLGGELVAGWMDAADQLAALYQDEPTPGFFEARTWAFSEKLLRHDVAVLSGIAQTGTINDIVARLKLCLERAAPPADGLTEARSLAQLVPDAVATMQARATGAAQPLELPPTMEQLSQALGGGLWPGMTVLVGNTGTGKSQFALQLALHAARQETPVLYVALELDETQLVARLAAMALAEQKTPQDERFSWSRLWRGDCSPELLEKAADPLRGLPLHVETGASFDGWSYERLEDRCRAIVDRYPSRSRPPLVVLDYLQVVAGPPDQRQDQRERIMRAAYAAREAARRHDAAVLLLSSTARQNYGQLSKRDGDEPVWQRPAYEFVGMGKESGEVEYGADNVLVMVRGDDLGPEGTEMHIGAAKVRAGQSSKAGEWPRFVFDGLRFSKATPRREAALGDDGRSST